jgi:hypothetical protein
MGIQGLLRAAKEPGSRRGVISATLDLVRRRGVFATGSEELTPVSIDAPSLVPLAVVATALILKPSLWKRLSTATVNAYAATTKVVDVVHGRT